MIQKFLIIVSVFFIVGCATNSEEKAMIKHQEDSIAMAEAMALELEAKVAQHMLDSAEAASKADSIREAELKKATQ
jgi:uncharacterized protein YcfL